MSDPNARQILEVHTDAPDEVPLDLKRLQKLLQLVVAVNFIPL